MAVPEEPRDEGVRDSIESNSGEAKANRSGEEKPSDESGELKDVIGSNAPEARNDGKDKLAEESATLIEGSSTLSASDVAGALEMLGKRYALETERIDKIDTKVAAFLAGLIATLAFLLDQATWWVAAAAILLLVPVAMLGYALRGREYFAVPQPYPVLWAVNNNDCQWLRAQVLADTAIAIRDTVQKTTAKVNLMNLAVTTAFVIIAIVAALKVVSLYGEQGAKAAPHIAGATHIRHVPR